MRDPSLLLLLLLLATATVVALVDDNPEVSTHYTEFTKFRGACRRLIKKEPR